MNKRQNPSDLLLRGGTLIANPCDKCHGVQIKYMNKIICANCGNETTLGKIDSLEFDYDQQTQTESNKLDIDLKEKIQKRINELVSNIGYDKTLSEEAQRIKIIKMYYSLMRKIDS
jgi:uncharacterized Zn finger protein (UPF0148 family)